MSIASEKKEIVHYTSTSNNLLLELSRLCYCAMMPGRVVVTQATWKYGPKDPEGHKLVRQVDLNVGITVIDQEGDLKRLGWNAEFRMEKENAGGWFPVSCDLLYNDNGRIRTVIFSFQEGSLDFLEDKGRDILAFIKSFYGI